MLTLYEPLVWLARTSGELPMCYENCFLRNAPSKYELNGMLFGSLGESTWLCSYREFLPIQSLVVWRRRLGGEGNRIIEFGGEPNKKTVGSIERRKKKEDCPVAERKRSRRRVQEESLFRSGCLKARQAEGTQTAGDGGEV